MQVTAQAKMYSNKSILTKNEIRSDRFDDDVNDSGKVDVVSGQLISIIHRDVFNIKILMIV